MILKAINDSYQFSVIQSGLIYTFSVNIKQNSQNLPGECPRQRETSSKFSNVCLIDTSIEERWKMFTSIPKGSRSGRSQKVSKNPMLCFGSVNLALPYFSIIGIISQDGLAPLKMEGLQ